MWAYKVGYDLQNMIIIHFSFQIHIFLNIFHFSAVGKFYGNNLFKKQSFSARLNVVWIEHKIWESN